MAEHTLGPWRIRGDAGHPANIRLGSATRPHIAKIYASDISRDLVCEANAHLIAAAPDLLAALIDAENRLAGAGMLGADDKVSRAIAKATLTLQ